MSDVSLEVSRDVFIQMSTLVLSHKYAQINLAMLYSKAKTIQLSRDGNP